MALSDADWNRLDRMRTEDREHLDQVTEKIDADSVRQWKAISALDKALDIHKVESDGTHTAPCETALHLMKEHREDSFIHNPKRAVPVISSVLALASTVGAWLSKFFHVKAEMKP